MKKENVTIMANAHPTMSHPQVSVTYYQEKSMGANKKATMRTHYNQTLKQADRAGVIRLDEEGKITYVGSSVPGTSVITINIPASFYEEDVYSLDLLKEGKD